MDQRTQGIVLRLQPLSETSLIVRWLTTDYGRISTVAKGAQRPKSPLRGKLDLLFEGDILFHRSRRGDLHTLREVSLRETHWALRQDLTALQFAAAGVRRLERLTETDTPIPELHALFCGWVGALSAGATELLALAFETKLWTSLGFDPTAIDAGISPGARAMLRHLKEDDWPLIRRLQSNPAQLDQLRRPLRRLDTEHGLGSIT